MAMQATYVKLEDRHRDLLQEQAQREGCTLSDLIRRATISFFSLPTDGHIRAIAEQTVPSRNEQRGDSRDVTAGSVAPRASSALSTHQNGKEDARMTNEPKPDPDPSPEPAPEPPEGE